MTGPKYGYIEALGTGCCFSGFFQVTQTTNYHGFFKSTIVFTSALSSFPMFACVVCIFYLWQAIRISHYSLKRQESVQSLISVIFWLRVLFSAIHISSVSKLSFNLRCTNTVISGV